MGNIIYNNGILLDERELGTLSLNGDDLANSIYDFLIATFSRCVDYDDGLLSLEVFGFAVERLDTSVSFEGFLTKACWIKEGRDFGSTLRSALSGVTLPDLDLVVREDHAALSSLRADLKQCACDSITAGSYGEAICLLTTLQKIGEDSLPGISPGWCLAEDCLTSAPMGQFEHIAERRVFGSS